MHGWTTRTRPVWICFFCLEAHTNVPVNAHRKLLLQLMLICKVLRLLLCSYCNVNLINLVYCNYEYYSRLCESIRITTQSTLMFVRQMGHVAARSATHTCMSAILWHPLETLAEQSSGLHAASATAADVVAVGLILKFDFYLSKNNHHRNLLL